METQIANSGLLGGIIGACIMVAAAILKWSFDKNRATEKEMGTQLVAAVGGLRSDIQGLRHDGQLAAINVKAMADNIASLEEQARENFKISINQDSALKVFMAKLDGRDIGTMTALHTINKRLDDLFQEAKK